MRLRFTALLGVFALGMLAASPVLGQGSFFTSLSGTIVDSSGLPIPGASVKVRNNGTGSEVDTVSGDDGAFTVPSLQGGNYSVTVSLDGFKTATLSSVTLNAAVPASVKVTLELGTIAENITVVGESATVVQTQSPAISTNITGQQITSLPLTSRNALDSLTSLPGFNTSGTARNSTVSGLPRSAINITLDGMSVQDNYLKTTDGYFARLSPLLDSVEEVTVTTAGNTADATGQGAVQIRFVTKSGHQQLERHGLRVPAPRRAQRQRVVPQPRPAAGSGDRQGAQGQAAQLSAGLRAGRPDRPQQGVLLLQLRRAARAELQHAPAHRPHAGSGRWHLCLQRGRQRAAREPAAGRRCERPARDARPGRAAFARRDPGGDGADRRPVAAEQPARSAVHLVDADQELQPVADDAHRL